MIDKLGLSTINWNITGKKASDIFENGSEKYYQNQIIKDYITLLIDPRTQHILHRSIDNDTELLKGVLKEIETSESSIEEPYGFYSLSAQTERKDDYITGKIGIGPFALNNNNHILTMLYGVRFKEFGNDIMSKLDLTDLSTNKDYEGNSVLSWISALINAHVDIAKDPYISRLNVNPFTYNLVNTLIRTGFGKKTFYFTTQPIMKELAKAYNNAASSYMADQYKSQYQLQKDAIEQVAKNRFGELLLGKWKFLDIVEGLQNPEDIKYKPVINDYIKQIFDSSTLRRNANRSYASASGTRINIAGDKYIDLDSDQVQMLMYFAYLQFNPYALAVSNLVKYSKIDTKKHGKSYIELQVYLKGFKKLFDNVDGTGLFEETGIKNMANRSYIMNKTINAISMTQNILKGQFLQSTRAFNVAINQMLSMVADGDSNNIDLHKELVQALMASIKSEFINEYADDVSNGDGRYIRDLVSESEEYLEYTQTAGSNRIKVSGSPKYNLKSYIGGKVLVSFEHEGTPWSFIYNVIGFDENTNELIVDAIRKVDNSGKIRITGGKNTVYDRFLDLIVSLREDYDYLDVFDEFGEFNNALLRSLVPGKTFSYEPPLQSGIRYEKSEAEDTYPTLKFIKLFNALDLNGVESNAIIDGWDELLHDNKHPKLKKFAEDLVVYAFVTSGDRGGFTKFFKQVPLSWRLESGYADFILRKLVEYQSQNIETEQLQDVLLNNWYNNRLVPLYNMYDKDSNTPNFIAYCGERQSTQYKAEIPYPVILAALKDKNGVYEPSIDPNNAPLFIKMPRRKDKTAKDSLRRVTVYKRVSFGMRLSATGQWVHYPIYVKIEPKGNLLRGDYLMTEYGREDAINKEYEPSVESLKKMYDLGDFIAKNTIQQHTVNWGNKFAQMIEDMNYQHLYGERFAGNEEAFVRALNRQLKTEEEVKTTTQLKSIEESNYTFTYARTHENGYEVSSKGDSRFSAMFAKFKEGTKLLGHDVGGRTIESVYQHAVKQDDWNTDNNSKTGAPRSKRIITGNTEDDSYNQGYLPLWKEWARQNPQLIEELRKNASGKVLTDQFASTKVSQARALADILNQTANRANRPLPEFDGISKQDVRKAISLAQNALEHAQGVVYEILYNAKYRKISEQDLKDLYEFQLRVDKYNKLLNGLYDGSSEVIINEYGVPQVVKKQTRRQNEVNSINQNIYDEYLNNPNNKRFNKLAKVVFNIVDKFGIQIEYDSEFEGLGKFVRGYNKILVNPNHGSTNTILHECIHAVTSYYLDAYEDNKESLPKEIQTAVEELKYCYDLLKNDAFETGDLTKDSPFLMYELGESDKYGLTNIHEFVAELSNPDFIKRIKDYDKRHDSSVFDKLIDIIAKILGVKKEYKDVLTTSYQALKVLLETPDNALFDKKEAEIRTMKENLKKINTDTTIILTQNDKYKPIIDAIEKEEDEHSEMTVTMDIGDIDFSWNVPNVKDKMALKGDVIKVVFNDNSGYIVLTKPLTKLEDKFTEDKKPFEMSFKVITAELLRSISFKINSNNNSFTQLSDETFDLLQKVYKNRKNNTELNRQRAESYVKAKTQGIYKFKDKLFAAWRAIGEINDQLGTTFLVEVNKTTLGVSVPSKSSSVRKNVNPYREYVDDSDVIFSLIYNESSEDSAILILELNGYNTNDESVLIALGKFIKKQCKGK